MKKRITLAITLGDINGIGPEVALKAVYGKRWPADARFVLIGATAALIRQARKLRCPVPAPWDPRRAGGADRKISLWDPTPSLRLAWQPGRITAAASRGAGEWIRAAVRGCRQSTFSAMITAPICKEGFVKAGIPFPGHTEMLAELTHTRHFAMMLLGGPLRVVLATRHIPISRVSANLTRESICEAIRLTGQALPWLGARGRRIGVCGLNPHAGEGGKIGREELTTIAPAIKTCRREKYDAIGPVPADTIFHYAVRGHYDAVVAMYHDQGLGPLKMLAFEQGVNVTLGLPIVRTSPDHGTAFDIAGTGRANPSSMIAAIELAYRLARTRNPWRKNG